MTTRRSFVTTACAALCATATAALAKIAPSRPAVPARTAPFTLWQSTVATLSNGPFPPNLRAAHYPMQGSAEEMVIKAATNAAFVCAMAEDSTRSSESLAARVKELLSRVS